MALVEKAIGTRVGFGNSRGRMTFAASPVGQDCPRRFAPQLCRPTASASDDSNLPKVDSHPCGAPGKLASKTLTRFVDLLRRFKPCTRVSENKKGPRKEGLFCFW